MSKNEGSFKWYAIGHRPCIGAEWRLNKVHYEDALTASETLSRLTRDYPSDQFTIFKVESVI